MISFDVATHALEALKQRKANEEEAGSTNSLLVAHGSLPKAVFRFDRVWTHTVIELPGTGQS
jgi:hypothetical protein